MTLPSDCFCIDTLKHISLAENQLEVFDINLSACAGNLVYLALHSNKIKQISDSISNCTNLTIFTIHKNCFE
jgi:Leucine-rich repeat (LRR) protein